jgi:hypothetical protein
MSSTEWVEAGTLRVGDLVHTPDGGGSSRVQFATEEDARAAGGPFERVQKLERTGSNYAIPEASNEVHVWLDGPGYFRRWPETGRVLLKRSND